MNQMQTRRIETVRQLWDPNASWYCFCKSWVAIAECQQKSIASVRLIRIIFLLHILSKQVRLTVVENRHYSTVYYRSVETHKFFVKKIINEWEGKKRKRRIRWRDDFDVIKIYRVFAKVWVNPVYIRKYILKEYFCWISKFWLRNGVQLWQRWGREVSWCSMNFVRMHPYACVYICMCVCAFLYMAGCGSINTNIPWIHQCVHHTQVHAFVWGDSPEIISIFEIELLPKIS